MVELGFESDSKMNAHVVYSVKYMWIYVLDANCVPGTVLGTGMQNIKHGCLGSWQGMAEHRQIPYAGLWSPDLRLFCPITWFHHWEAVNFPVSPSSQEQRRHFLRITPSPALKSLAVPTVEKEPGLLPSSLIILAFWRRSWIALLFKYQNIQLTQLISITSSSQKNGNLDAGFQRFPSCRPSQTISC